MMNDTHVRQLLSEPVADLARATFAAVVHHNDLKNWSDFRLQSDMRPQRQAGDLPLR